MTETHSIHIKVDSTDAQKASKNLSDMEKATNGAEKALVNLTRAAVGLVTLEALKRTAAYAIEAADSFTLMSSKLKLATSSQEEFTKAQTALFKIAQANSTELASTVDLYTRVSRGMKEMGSSQADILKMTNAVGQALKISGASTSEASSVITQFGQALGSGVLRGEEFNAIMENGNRLARALADGLGVPLKSLRSLAEQGQLTGDIVTKAILSQTAALNSEASTMQTTVSQAWTQLENAIVTYIGQADQANGTTKDLSDAIVLLAKNFTDLADPIANALSYIAKVEVGGWIALSEAIGTAKIALQEMVGIQQAGAGDPETLKLMKMGQGQMSIDEIAGKQAEVTEKTVAKASAATGIHLANTGKAAKKAADEAQKAFQATIEANVKAAENAARILSAQMDNQKRRYEIEADQIKGNAELQIRRTKSESMRLAIAEEAQTKIIEAINQETNLRQAGLDKEIETIQVKLAGVQQEIDAADAHKLKQSERIELTTKLSDIETELAVKRQERTMIELDAIGQIQSAERDLADARQQANETMVKEEALRQLEIMSSNLEYAKEMATGLAEAFGEVGAAIGGMSVAMAEYDKQSATIEIARKEAVDKAEGDQKRITEINDDATKKQAKAQIKAYGDMTQAAQGFFKKGSKGYEAMGAAVKVFRAFEMAQSAMSMVKQLGDMGSILAQFLGMETTKTTAKIASNTAQQSSDAAGAVTSATKAVADAGQGDPYTGIIRAAAMLAFMAAIGIAVGGGGGGGSAPATPPPEPGTGTVKGDPFAVSESISKSIGIIEENSSNDLNYSADMLDALYQIRDALGGVENLIASDLTPAISNLMLKFGDGVKQAGFVFRDQQLSKILSTGRVEGYIGARVETESSQMMITVKKGQTMVAEYGKRFAEAFGGVVTAIKDSIVEVGKVIGVTDAEITERLKGFKVKLGTIDIAGLSAEEAAKKIEAAFSAMSDTMAMKALPEFKDFQQSGEGYKETIVRVAEGIQRATGNLELLGMEAIKYTDITNKNKDVAAEITRQTIMAQGDLSEGTRKYVSQLTGSAEDIIESYKQILNITNLMRGAGFGTEDIDRTMINAAGGLSAFEESLQSFRENFMTDAQRLSADTEQLTKEFKKLGFELPHSKDQFYDLASGIDRSTEDGKKLFAQFITLSQAFSDLADATKNATDATAEMMESLQSGVKSAAQDLLKAFQAELSTLEKAKQQWIQAYKALNSALQAEVKSLIDNYKAIRTNLLSAKNVLKDAYGQEAASMQAVIDKTKNLSLSLRDFIKTLSTTSSNISPEQRYASSRATFEGTATRALSGDATAKEALQSMASDFLDSSKQYNASSEAYLRDYEAVVSTLNKVADQADEQVSLVEQQLNVLKKQVEQYVVLTEATISVKDAVKQVELAQLAETEAADILNDTLVANGLMTEEQLTSLRESGDMNATSTQQKLDEMKVSSGLVLEAQQALKTAADQIYETLVKNGWMTEQEFNDLINGGNGTGAVRTGIDNLNVATQEVITAQNAVAATIDLLAEEFGISIDDLKGSQADAAKAIVDALNAIGGQIAASVGQAFSEYKAARDQLDAERRAREEAEAARRAAEEAARQVPPPAPAPAPEPAPAPTPVDNSAEIEKQRQRAEAASNYTSALNAALRKVENNTANASAAYTAGYETAAADFLVKAQEQQKVIARLKAEIKASGLNLRWERNGGGFVVRPYANGGMAEPGLSLVGENGPELVSFGSRGHVSTANQTQGFFTGLQAVIEKGDADQTNELQALVRLQSAANQQLIKEMKELKGEMAELARKAKLEAAA